MKYKFSSFTRLVWAVIVFVMLLTIAGRVVFLTGAALTCSGSPFCIPANSLGWIKFVHLALVGISALLIIWLFLKAWREQRDDQLLLPLTTVTTVLFFGQAFVGAIQVVRNFPIHLVVLHTLTAARALDFFNRSSCDIRFIGTGWETISKGGYSSTPQ